MRHRALFVIDDGRNAVDRDVACRYWSEVLQQFKTDDVSVATLRSGSPLETSSGGEGIPIHGLGSGRVASLPLIATRLARLIRRGRFDVVHAHEVIPALATGLARHGDRRVRSIFHRHHWITDGIHARLSRRAAHSNHLVACVSEATAEAARALDGASEDTIRVVPNGVVRPRAVSPDDVAAWRKEWAVEPGEAVVIAIGRLRDEKGHRFLIEALDLMSSRVRTFIVGDGPARGKLTALASSSRARVDLVGHSNDIALWLAAADVVVQPSLKEAFGLTVVEAMASGRAVVASGVGGLLETVVPDETGVLVAPGDPRQIAMALAAILADDQRREHMGTAARRRFETHYSMEMMVTRWRALYEELASTGSTART